MNSKQIRSIVLLFLTAFIWGSAFVAQSTGGNAVGPYTFNAVRSIIGGIALIPVTIFLDKKELSLKKPSTAAEWKKLMLGGILCGILLCISSNLQQFGLFLGATPGKAGFLTACYILIVPILGIFIKRKCGWNVWLGVILTLIGLYLLCCTDNSLALNFADILLLLCALGFSIHILVIDRFAPFVDGVRMSMIQFFVCGILSAVPAIFVDIPRMTMPLWLNSFSTSDAWIPLLYAGLLSCGVAYTLQIIAQDGIHPAIASLIMSLESVFAVLAGWIILGDTLSFRETVGCILMFTAIILAQLPIRRASED